MLPVDGAKVAKLLISVNDIPTTMYMQIYAHGCIFFIIHINWNPDLVHVRDTYNFGFRGVILRCIHNFCSFVHLFMSIASEWMHKC